MQTVPADVDVSRLRYFPLGYQFCSLNYHREEEKGQLGPTGRGLPSREFQKKEGHVQQNMVFLKSSLPWAVA